MEGRSTLSGFVFPPKASFFEAFDGNGLVRSASFSDEWGQILYSETEGAQGMVRTERSYDAAGRVIAKNLPHKVGAASQGQIRYQYDALGRKIRQILPVASGDWSQGTDPNAVAFVQFTNQAGLSVAAYAVKESRPDGQQIYTYKTLDGQTVQIEYETSYASASSPLSQQRAWARVRYHYNAAGKRIAITRGIGFSRTAIADDPKKTIRFAYDAYGRMTAKHDPDKGSTTITYNAEGQPECVFPPDGKVLCRRYDANGRLVSLHQGSLAGPVLARYKYGESESAFGGGRLTSVQDKSGHRRYHYDPITGKVARIERTYIAEGRIQKFEVANTYGPGGMLLSREFPATGLRVMYRYYSDGSIREVSLYDPDGRIVREGNGSVLANFAPPDALGNVAEIQYANGTKLEFQYDARTGQLRSRRAESPMAGLILDEALSFTDEGFLKKIQDHLQAGRVDLSRSFRYDVSHRLVEARGPYGDLQNPGKTLRYSYGEDGEPLWFEGKSVLYDRDGSHRSKKSGDVQYVYDTDGAPDGARGNVIRRTNGRGESWAFTYNYQNLVSSVEKFGTDGQSRIEMLYDSDGRLFRKQTRDVHGVETSLYQPASDYRIFVDGGDETHTLFVYTRQGLLAQLGFNARVHLAAGGANYHSRAVAFGESFTRLLYGNGPFWPQVQRMGSSALLYAMQHPKRNAYIAYFVEILLLFAALVWLFALWKRHDFAGFRRKRVARVWGGLPRPVFRLTALFTLLAFEMTLFSCMGASGVNDSGVIPVFGSLANPYSGANGTSQSANIEGLVGTKILGLGAFRCAPKDLGVCAALKVAQTNYFYITDAQGTITHALDVRGKLLRRYVYKPFGRLNESLTWLDPERVEQAKALPRRFTGQTYEAAVGLYNYKARFYDQHTGRFLQPDPVQSENAGYDEWFLWQKRELVTGNRSR